jgi:hypothetical protein
VLQSAYLGSAPVASPGTAAQNGTSAGGDTDAGTP